MGNKVSRKNSFNLREREDLNQFLTSINMLEGFYVDTSMSVSSKCLVIINNLINDIDSDTIQLMPGLEIAKDRDLSEKITRLKFHCGLIRHLTVVNSSTESVEELVELSNVYRLTSLCLDHVPVRFVQHLKQHRSTLLSLSVHSSLNSLESVIGLCGGDHSFSDKWLNLQHLDVRNNRLRMVDDSVIYLTSLTVLDISRNDIDDLSFVQKIPTLVCLNASFNFIRSIPDVIHRNIRVLILGYNYLDGLEGIKGFKVLSTLNVSYNMIATNDYLQQLKEMDLLQDVILRGNPLFFSQNYRQVVLDIISPRVSKTFAIDGKYLSKKEEIYLRKRPMISIPPALSPPTQLYKKVPVIKAPNSDGYMSSPQTNPSSHTRRTLQRKMIENSSEGVTVINDEDDIGPLSGRFLGMKEKKIVSISESEIGSTMIDISQAFISEIMSEACPDDSYLHSPNYVGEKSSNVYIASPIREWKSFSQVSMQIIEHKLMAVNELNHTVENINLWQLLAVPTTMIKEQIDSKSSLKMVFFDSCDEDNNGQLILFTIMVEFCDADELNNFMDMLKVYLNGFSISYENWIELPLTKLSINCIECTSILYPNKEKHRQYICSTCFGNKFLLQGTEPQSTLPSIINIPNLNILQKKDINKQNISPDLKKLYSKHSTSDFIIRAFGSTESLMRRNQDKDSLHSDNPSCQTESYHTALNDSNNEISQDGVSQSSICSSLKGSIRNDDKEEPGLLDLDKAVNSEFIVLDQSLSFHDTEELNEAFAFLKSLLKLPWVLHESSCDINIHMHNSKKIDDRLKLYFLTKVMNDQEDLIAIFKVYFAYKSTGISSNVLLVISNVRLMIFNISDKISSNMEECLKVVSEFQLKSLQQLEYCLNSQWLELQFKGKAIITIFTGDSDSVKNIGCAIADAASGRTAFFSIIFSKELKKLKYPQILTAMTTDLIDGATLESLSISESYLIKNSSVLPKIEKSSLEYVPKFIVIEAEHIFFITFTNSPKNNRQLLVLSRVILLYNVKNNLIVDSTDDCTIRLEMCENGENSFFDIQFMSPHSRSKAAFCIGQMLKELFRVEIMFSLEDLSQLP